MSKVKDTLFSPVFKNNPIALQILGICSALAVTTQIKPTLVMCLALTFVVGFSSLFVSLIRRYVPSSIRIIVQMVIIASMVIIADQLLKAYLYDISKQLSVFVGLIITNCIVMGRLEAFALGNGVWKSFLDGVGNALGYGWILIVVAFIRELFGSGELFGVPVIPQFIYDLGYTDNGLMLLSPMALIVVGVYIWIQRYFNRKLIEKD